ncbi:placenta-specific protein 9-like [Hypomesus transpacificus]|uniref:placenta-specific protein 9-like n=1 Tax=Hypomesus transpacificus TaxID=137520 RepID=UPI001F085277|nr:placenta-specific protein 9-like [Hypomesus transpacificus]
MTRPFTSTLGLLMLLIGFAVAGPAESNLLPRTVRASACQEHGSLHNRLDVVEKRVEETVSKLETELALLLDAIESPEWSPLLDTRGKPEVDILDGQGEKGGS